MRAPSGRVERRTQVTSTRAQAGAVAAMAVLLVLAAAPASAQAAPPGCVTSASTAGAVEQLYGSGTEPVSEERVAGLDTILALEPRILPGTRHRAIRVADDRFCDATTGFNEAWSGD